MSRQSSNTAAGVAVLRVAHMVVDGEPKILNDAAVVQLMGPSVVENVRTFADELRKPGALALRAHVVLRSRFAEDSLERAVARGVRQYIVLGAGGDTFAYRQPGWARDLRIVEVDHPASQDVKRHALSVVGLEMPANLTFASIDFETTSLRDGLTANGVDLSLPTFFSWLGVTMYLTEPAVDLVFQTVREFPKGSEIVFTFANGPRIDDSTEGPTLAERAAAAGEPWLSYFEPEVLEAKLRAFGFSDVSFLMPERAQALYFEGRTDGLSSPRRVSIGAAVV